MKKSKLSAGIMTGLLAVGALAGCSKTGPDYSSNGVILTYEVNGQKIEYTANDLFKDTALNPEHAEEMFNQVYKLVIRNYFTIDNPDGEGTNTGLHQMEAINKAAADKVKIDKDTAKTNSDTNNTSEKTEFETILQSKGCEDEEELLEYYVFEEQQAKFKENFYKIYADESNTKWPNQKFNYLRDHSVYDTDESYVGYLETKVPYHVSHILVNVDDGASNNYWNGTISSANTKKLYDVVQGLKDDSVSFGSVAQMFSDDGSKSEYGELGIVDKDKATEDADKYVKEFILGLYSYDNLYNPDPKVRERVKEYKTITPSTIGKISDEPNFILESVFKDIYDVREVEGSEVIGTSTSNFYPRNIYYNNFLNDHGVNLIVKKYAGTGTYASEPEGYREGNFVKLAVPGAAAEEYLILCASQTNHPVLVTRAGASYQGIHFIVANRSPFEDDVAEHDKFTKMRDLSVDGVKLSDYYTTKYPTQTDYPVSVDKPTFVRQTDTDVATYKERADKVAEEIKTFDTNIERFIYERYFNLEKGKLQFTEAGQPIKETIENWIVRSKQQTLNTTYNSWEDYWGEYIDMLEMQTEQKSKKLKPGCAIAFNLSSKANTPEELNAINYRYENGISGTLNADLAGLVSASTTFDELFNQRGGACNDGETHK